jgi:hypothetical protein
MMRRRPAAGAVLLPLVFAALGAVWVAGAAGMPLWQGFAPAEGFLPMIYGALLLLLAAAALAEELLTGGEAETPAPVGKPLLVLGAVAACVVGLEAAGFGPAMFLLLAFLFAVVERLPALASLGAAAGVTAALMQLFRTWLGVPLPVGPLGF